MNEMHGNESNQLFKKVVYQARVVQSYVRWKSNIISKTRYKLVVFSNTVNGAGSIVVNFIIYAELYKWTMWRDYFENTYF